jgi:hypothetical protein
MQVATPSECPAGRRRAGPWLLGRGGGRAYGLAAGVLATAAACSPSLDWREVRPQGTAVNVLLPCKPKRSARMVALAGRPVRMSMLACTAEQWTWALAAADVGEPAQVGPALLALREGALANVQGQVLASQAAVVQGATPHDAGAALRIKGRRPDGAEANVRLVVFSHGTQVFQATVIGSRPPAAAADPFFDSLRVAVR